MSQMLNAAVECRANNIQIITVAAEPQMEKSAELRSIASEPLSQNMFVTSTLSTVLSASDGVVGALCNGM